MVEPHQNRMRLYLSMQLNSSPTSTRTKVATCPANAQVAPRLPFKRYRPLGRQTGISGFAVHRSIPVGRLITGPETIIAERRAFVLNASLLCRRCFRLGLWFSHLWFSHSPGAVLLFLALVLAFLSLFTLLSLGGGLSFRRRRARRALRSGRPLSFRATSALSTLRLSLAAQCGLPSKVLN